jgi:hypothetical protein
MGELLTRSDARGDVMLPAELCALDVEVVGDDECACLIENPVIGAVPSPIGKDGRKRSSTRRRYSVSSRAVAVRVPVKYKRLIWLLVSTRNSKQSLAIRRSRSVRCDAKRSTSSSPRRFGRMISFNF